MKYQIQHIVFRDLFSDDKGFFKGILTPPAPEYILREPINVIKSMIKEKTGTSRHYGVELEYEALKWQDDCIPTKVMHSLKDKYPILFRTVDDGSLRYGLEFCIKPRRFTTYSLSKLAQFIKDVYDAAPNINFNSQRAGTHVHVNVLDFTVLEFFYLIHMCYLFCSALGTYSSGRKMNMFCLPFSHKFGGIRFHDIDEKRKRDEHKGSPQFDAPSFLEETDIDKLITKFSTLFRLSRENKYHDINISSLYYTGTVEFRQLECTQDIQRIINWIKIVVNFINVSKTLPGIYGDDVHGGIQKIADNPVQFVEDVCSPFIDPLCKSTGASYKDITLLVKEQLESLGVLKASIDSAQHRSLDKPTKNWKEYLLGTDISKEYKGSPLFNIFGG